MITRRTFLSAAGAAVLLAGCSKGTASSTSSSSPAGATKLTMGLTYQPDVQFALAYVAAEKGYFSEAGVTMELRHHGAQESLFGAMAAGTEQVVFAGGDEMMQAREQGTDVVNIATCYQQYPVELIVPEASAIKSGADLRGHSIGIPGPYGENYFGLLALLKANGLKPSDVDVQHIGYTQHAALTGGKVDSVVGFSNNDAVRFKLANFAIRQIPIGAQVPLIGAGLGATSAAIKDQPDALKGVVSAMAKALEFCRANPDEAVTIAAKYVPTLSDAEAKEAARATLDASLELYGTKFGAQDPARWASMSTFMAEQELVGKQVPAEQSFTSDFAGTV